MSRVVDLRPSPLPEPLQALGSSPMALIAGFASLAQRCRNIDALLAGATQALGAALPYTQVLVVDSAGQPSSVQSAAALGWGDVPARHLADRFVTLPRHAGTAEAGPQRCTIAEWKGRDLAELNAALTLALPSGPFAAATTVHCALRGHLVVALLGSLTPTPALSAADGAFCSAVCSILASSLQFGRRARDYARRLKQVRRAKIAWEGTVDALPHIVCVMDEQGRVTRANRAIEAWGLGSVIATAPGNLHSLLHPDCVNPQCGLAKRLAMAFPRGSGPESQEFEYPDPVLGRDLRIRIGHARPTSRRDERKTVRRRFAVIEDITRERLARRKVARVHQELKRTLRHHSLALTTTHEHLRAATSQLADTQLELGEARRRHRLVLENTNAGLLMVKQGRVAYCNHRFEEILGYARGELAGAAAQDFLPTDCIPERTICSVDGEPVTAPERLCEVKRKDGSTVWLRHAEVGFFTENDHVRFITVVNVTDQVLAEQAMEASRKELQRLSRCLMSSQEDERKRIAGELHDGIGQSLSAVKLMLQNVLVDAAGHTDDRLLAQLSACVGKTQEMIEDVRRLSMALRPAIIDSGGVILALHRLCREMRDSVRGLAVHLTITVDEADLADTLKIHLFRIVQEALNNIIRHARADNVWVQLERCDAGLRLAIRDDGVGFDPAGMDARSRGLGLSGMQQRARLCGGELTIDSAPGHGTTISTTWAGPVGRKRKRARTPAR